MINLEKLTQGEDGKIYRPDKTCLRCKNAVTKGKLKTIIVPNRCSDILRIIRAIAEGDSNFIPEDANAYLVSDINVDTRHMRKVNSNGDKESYLIYALQFYHAYPPLSDR